MAPTEGGLLTSLTWQLNPVLSVLWDNVTQTKSSLGWTLADSKLTVGPPSKPPLLNGGLSLIPSASPVTVTFSLSMSSTYSSTLLTQRVPVTQLLANIVGLSGILAFFGTMFGAFEAWTNKRRKARGLRPLSSSANPTEASPSALKAHVEPPAREEDFATTLNPLHAGNAATKKRAGNTLPTGPQRWRRQFDGEDVWFVDVDSGRTEWEIPVGGVEVE